MSRTTGEALRERLTTIVMQARHNGNRSSPYSHEDYVRRIAAAIVEELGITREAICELGYACDPAHYGNLGEQSPLDDIYDALLALLDCAEVEP